MYSEIMSRHHCRYLLFAALNGLGNFQVRIHYLLRYRAIRPVLCLESAIVRPTGAATRCNTLRHTATYCNIRSVLSLELEKLE